MVKVSNEKLAEGANGSAEFYEGKLVTGRYFMERVDARDGGAPRPPLDRRRHDDGAARRGVLIFCWEGFACCISPPSGLPAISPQGEEINLVIVASALKRWLSGTSGDVPDLPP